MPALYLHIDESWPEEDNTSIPWALFEERNFTLETGVATTIEELPPATLHNVIAPASLILLTSVEEPEKNRRLFYKSLSFAVEDYTLTDPESLHVTAGPRDAGGFVPVAVIDRQWMANVLTRLADQGITPDAMYVETLLAPIGDDSFSVVLNGAGSFARTGEFSGFALDDCGEGAPPAALQLAIDKAGEGSVQEIEAYSANGSAPMDISVWRESLGLKVNHGGGWNWSDSIKGSTLDSLNLLQGEFAPQSKLMAAIPRLKPTLILLCAVAALQFGVICAEWLLLKNEASRLQIEIDQSFKKAFPEAKVIVDAPLQMRRNLADLRWRAGGEDGDDLIPVLDEIALILPAGAPLKSLQYDKGVVKVELVVSGAEYIEELRTRFNKTGFDVKNVETRQKEYGLEARFTIARKAYETGR